MSINRYLEAMPFKEIEKFIGNDHLNTVMFFGVPRKHPYDQEKCLLFSDPLESSVIIYEFTLKDIIAAEEMPSPVTEKGENFSMVKLWVKKGSFAMKFEPFEVQDTLRFHEDSNLLKKHILDSLKQ